MALDSNSRYKTAPANNTRGGSTLVGVRRHRISSTYDVYVTKDGDTFDRLAAKVFGDSTQYWRIADLNPQVAFPDVIPIGTYLRVPR